MDVEDEDEDFDADANDGFGALTGAIDQLAFTNDLDFDGDVDGVDLARLLAAWG